MVLFSLPCLQLPLLLLVVVVVVVLLLAVKAVFASFSCGYFMFLALGRISYSLCYHFIVLSVMGGGVCTVENHKVNHTG